MVQPHAFPGLPHFLYCDSVYAIHPGPRESYCLTTSELFGIPKQSDLMFRGSVVNS